MLQKYPCSIESVVSRTWSWLNVKTCGQQKSIGMLTDKLVFPHSFKTGSDYIFRFWAECSLRCNLQKNFVVLAFGTQENRTLENIIGPNWSGQDSNSKQQQRLRHYHPQPWVSAVSVVKKDLSELKNEAITRRNTKDLQWLFISNSKDGIL